jgi:hypothetical protein
MLSWYLAQTAPLPLSRAIARTNQTQLCLCLFFTHACAEFINLVSSEANELCDKEKKNTIVPEHVVASLEASHTATSHSTHSLTLHTTVCRHAVIVRKT